VSEQLQPSPTQFSGSEAEFLSKVTTGELKLSREQSKDALKAECFQNTIFITSVSASHRIELHVHHVPFSSGKR
jgi:hypothetical protein